MSDDDLGQKTVDAHLWINGVVPDKGCEGNQKFERGVRYVIVGDEIQCIDCAYFY